MMVFNLRQSVFLYIAEDGILFPEGMAPGGGCHALFLCAQMAQYDHLPI